MKLWDKDIQTDKLVEQFTVGKDRELDLLLARYDVLGSIAHAIMLERTGLITVTELENLRNELQQIYETIEKGDFTIENGIEDVHSQVELILTRKWGDTGKKIHTARSRNDQVLLDIKLFIRDQIHGLTDSVQDLFKILLELSDQHREVLMPGYTHMQVAMPSSFGLWFAAYAETLIDDIQMLYSAYRITDQNPLGSAAGYGSSFPVDRKLTTDLLGFSEMNYNSINAQMSRGKTERVVSFALASLASTLSKLAGDICLFSSQNFDFITIPDELTTGSSIMPHKKNPDIFELLRAKCNKMQSLPNEIDHISINLPLGYNRDMQIIKESFLPVFEEMKYCLYMMKYAVPKIIPNTDILNDERYKYLFSVDDVNNLVKEGLPFREAYKEIARRIMNGTYSPSRALHHTHEGSIGNLCNEKIAQKMEEIMRHFHFEKKENAYKALLNQDHQE
jgi:argininosuccinate lyase